MKDQNHDSSDDMFEKMSVRSVISTLIGILIGIVVIAILWFSTSNYQNSVRVAAIGGTVSLYGIIVMSLPVFWRSYQSVANLIILGQPPKIYKLLEPELSDTERKKREIQQRIYLDSRELTGQYLIGIGTFINGFSGFF